MPRVIRMDLQYEGTGYHGFARQPGRPTIQDVLERALVELLGQQVAVTPAGRTDAGVHALGQVVSFRTTAGVPAAAISRGLQSRLPEDVIAGPSREASSSFDARRSARRRHYRYSILNRERACLRWRRFSLRYPDRLDETAMQSAAGTLLGRHDFSSFIGHAAQQTVAQSPERTVYEAEWSRQGDLLHFDCVADAYGRHMMRNLVGTMLWVGRGRLTADNFGAVLAGRDRRLAGPTASPEGLTLMNVEYADRENYAC